MTRISIIIATFNRRDILARTLPLLFAQDFPATEYEVIVVIDGSTDGTGELLRVFKPLCKLRILEQPNKGPAAARNNGLRVARGHLVLFLDDDILCARTLLGEHVAAHAGADPLVAFGPILLAPESPRTLATDWTEAYTDDYVNRLTREKEPQWPRDAMIDANSSAPRSMLLACGGFDERFVRARETADFGLRLWKMGVRFRYLPTAVTYHLYVKPTRDLVQTDARWYGRNEVLLCRKHPDYRPYSALAGLGDGPLWKRFVRWLAVRLPLLPELLVGLSCWMLERLRWIPSIRIIGVRLLQVWQGIAMYRSALGETGSWDALCREFGIRLPVLIYHHVGPMQPNTYPELTISPQQFERQVSWLARHGYVGICSSDWLAWLRKGEPLPKKPVLLAFDDAYADIAEYALPVLQRYDFSATVFVVTRQIGGTNAWDVAQGSGTRQLMTAGQIKEWANKGIEFGAHSRTHPDLTNLTNAELDEEVAGSADDLAGILGNRIISFAYPGGYYNHAVRDFVQSTFDLAFSCNSGVNDLKTDPYILRRTMVQPCDFLIDLGCRVRLGWSPINRLRSYLRLRSRARALMQLLSAQNS